jgi:hypothetical protein
MLIFITTMCGEVKMMVIPTSQENDWHLETLNSMGKSCTGRKGAPREARSICLKSPLCPQGQLSLPSLSDFHTEQSTGELDMLRNNFTTTQILLKSRIQNRKREDTWPFSHSHLSSAVELPAVTQHTKRTTKSRLGL